MLPLRSNNSIMHRFYQFLNSLQRGIDAGNVALGRTVAWLCVLMVFTSCAITGLRYGFNLGFIAMQESLSYMHASVFMLGAAYTFSRGGHVRVDILYRNFSRRRKAWIDALGALLFLLPFSLFLMLISSDFVSQAWSIRESSVEAGGLPLVFVLKTLIPVMGLSLFLQGIADLLRNTLILVGFKAETP